MTIGIGEGEGVGCLVSVRTFSVMYDHAFLNFQITRSDHTKWAVSPVIAYGHFNLPQELVFFFFQIRASLSTRLIGSECVCDLWSVGVQETKGKFWLGACSVKDKNQYKD